VTQPPQPEPVFADRTLEGSRPLDRKNRHAPIWVGTWILATAATAAIILSARELPEPSAVTGSIALLAQALATVALIKWLGPVPAERLPAAAETRRGRLALMITLSVLALFPVGTAGLIVMAPVGVAAVIVLAGLRPEISGRAIGWALVLAALATIGGLIEWSASATSLGIALAQVPLVFVAFLAFWAMADRVGWVAAEVGAPTFLTAGPGRAVRDFGFGVLVAAPWALGNIANGPFAEDRGFHHGWQAFAALRPGVAEEVWIRAFVIVLVYWLFRRYARARIALVIAALLGTYWFAFLHVPFNPATMILLGTLQLLPMTYVWLRRGLEAAIGFHFCVDLIRFLAAVLAFQGIWFT
jgi:hypothetical protein